MYPWESDFRFTLWVLFVDPLRLECMIHVVSVSEYLNVFIDEFARLSLERVVKFNIDLIPGMMLISKVAYQMELIELAEVKHQLKELKD